MCYASLCFVINHKALGCVAPQKEEKTRKAVCSESADKKTRKGAGGGKKKKKRRRRRRRRKRSRRRRRRRRLESEEEEVGGGGGIRWEPAAHWSDSTVLFLISLAADRCRLTLWPFDAKDVATLRTPCGSETP